MQIAERDAARMRTDTCGLTARLDLLARAHSEFVDGVVARLREQDENAVLRVVPVAEAACTCRGGTDVLERGEGLDADFG